MKKLDFLIYYETVPREYENACLLKCELERRGYTVAICNIIRRDYWKSIFYSPKVILVSGIYGDGGINKFINRNRTSVRAKVVDLRYEQLVRKNKHGEPRNLPKGKSREVYHICWGDGSVEQLHRFGIESKYLIKTGPLQFDLSRDEFKDYFFEREEIAGQFDLDKTKKWILFTSSLAYGAMSEEQVASISDAHRRPDIVEYADYMRKVVALLLDWTDLLLTNNPDMYFIYRPHPSEPPSHVFDDLLQKHQNFRIIREYSVKQWFHVVDIVNTWNSTSIVECYYCKKPCCVIDLPEDEKYKKFRIDVIDNSKIIRNYEAFEQFNKDADSFRHEEFPILEEKRAYYYEYESDMPVYYKLCNFLEEVLKEKKYEETFSLQVTKEMRRRCWNDYKVTFRGDVYLKLFPLINRIFPNKCKVDSMLDQHNTKKLKAMEEGIRKQVLRTSEKIETHKHH